jgi:hypothetical protein
MLLSKRALNALTKITAGLFAVAIVMAAASIVANDPDLASLAFAPLTLGILLGGVALAQYIARRYPAVGNADEDSI